MKIRHQQREVAAAVEVGSVRWGQLHTRNVKNLLAVRKYAEESFRDCISFKANALG